MSGLRPQPGIRCEDTKPIRGSLGLLIGNTGDRRDRSDTTASLLQLDDGLDQTHTFLVYCFDCLNR